MRPEIQIHFDPKTVLIEMPRKRAYGASMKKRRLLLLSLWILSLIAISVYGGTVSYGFFFVVSLIPVISLLYLLSVYYSFNIYQEIQSRNITCRQPVPYHMVLQNDSPFAFVGVSVRLFPQFSQVKELRDDTEFELYPGERYLLDTELLCKYRGEYEVGVREVILTDFFRIFRLHYKVPGTIKALVLPQVLRLETLHSIPDIAVRIQKDSVYNQNQPDIPVRDYLTGDSLKQIHWKASAKEQKLKTRTRTGEEKTGMILLYDTQRYDKQALQYLPLENQILETVLALSYFFARKNIPFSVLWSQNGLQQHNIDSLSGYDALFQRTASVLFDERENFTVQLKGLCDSGLLYRARTMIAVLHEMNDEIMTMTEKLTAAGIEVILYLITVQNTDTYTRRCSARCRIITVPVEADLERLL